MYIEKVLDLFSLRSFLVQLMKNGGKNKSVAFIILFSVCNDATLEFLDESNFGLKVYSTPKLKFCH